MSHQPLGVSVSNSTSARSERTLQDIVYSRGVIFTVTGIVQFKLGLWNLKALCQALVKLAKKEHRISRN
jgi:hypothetical protein